MLRKTHRTAQHSQDMEEQDMADWVLPEVMAERLSKEAALETVRQAMTSMSSRWSDGICDYDVSKIYDGDLEMMERIRIFRDPLSMPMNEPFVMNQRPPRWALFPRV